MDAIERAAHTSVGRACGFCALAILCFMVGFAYQPDMSARVGGTFALVVAIVLMVMAWRAHQVNYKHTETWLILSDTDRPDPEVAQDLISRILRQTYFQYAWYAAITAFALIGASMVMSIRSGSMGSG